MNDTIMQDEEPPIREELSSIEVVLETSLTARKPFNNKIPLLPEYYQGREGDYVMLKNYEGNSYKYYDPIK